LNAGGIFPVKNLPAGIWNRVGPFYDPAQPGVVSRFKISPGLHSAWTSIGRQQTAQSVVNRWLRRLVSMAKAKVWPQNGQGMSANSSMREN